MRHFPPSLKVDPSLTTVRLKMWYPAHRRVKIFDFASEYGTVPVLSQYRNRVRKLYFPVYQGHTWIQEYRAKIFSL